MMYYLQIVFYIALLCPAFLRARECPSTDHESLLQPEQDYYYTFQGDAVVHTPDNQESRISLRCDVTISHVKACHFGLHLQSCWSSEGSRTEDQTSDLISKHPVLFSLVNGEIVQIYSNEEEPLQVLNIKRGILSAFVFKLSHTKRTSQQITTDIHGSCPLTATPQVTVKGSVKTSRNLLMCNRTDKHEEMSKFFSDKNAVDSTIECDYGVNVEDRFLNQVNCTEKHTIDTIQSNIYYRMVYKSSHLQKRKPNFSSSTRRGSIEFEQKQQTPQDPEYFERVAQDMLSQIVEHSSNGIGISTISEFTDLVAWLRSSSNLTALLKEIQEKNCLRDGVDCLSRKKIGISYFADALIHCNSVPCIEAISHLIKCGEFSPPNSIYYSWSNMLSPDPAILKHIKNICLDTDSGLCWMTLGRLVQRIYLKQKNLTESKELLFEAVKYFKKSIEFLCASPESDPVSLRRNLEIIKSMGDAYGFLLPKGYEELMKCLLKCYIPDDIKILISEVLNAMNLYHDETSGKEMYKEFSRILLNSTLSTNVRIIAYDQIIRIPQNDELENILLTILKTEENLQLKSHIAKSLKTLYSNTNMKNKEKRFIAVMQELLKKEQLSLHRIIHEAEAKFTTERSLPFLDLSRILQELSVSGFQTLNSNDPKSSKESFKWNDAIFLQVIRYLGQVFEFRDQNFMKFETLATLLQEVAKDIWDQLPTSDKLFKTIHEALKQFETHSKPPQEYSYSETILNNIKKLEEMYRKHKPESKTFFNRVSDFIGSTWHYLSSGEIFQLPATMLDMHALLRDLEKGVYYNSTKMIRIMEVHQQVPTMMGLPLRWDASAVLALSLRSALKLEMQPENFEMLFEGYFQPSAALTYLNGMVIDLLSVAQAGVQANRSAFASTEWKAKLYYSEERKILSFNRPSRSKNILQFFDTHRLMKNGTWYDGEYLGRDTSSRCKENLLSSLLGLQFCLLQSHSKLPKSNYWTWQAFLQPSDEEIESLDFEFLWPREMKHEETILKYSAVGSRKRREIFFVICNINSTGEIKFQLTIPAMPDFNFFIQSQRETRNHKTVMNLTLYEGHQYELIYKAEYGLKESPSDAKKISENAVVQERSLSFRTPFNNYSVILTDYGKNGIESTRVHLSHNGFNSDNKWLLGILPQSFWETDTTAWLQIQIFWNIEITKTSQQTICIIEDPQTATQFSIGFLHLDGGERKYICASKRQSSSGKPLAFAHFTYDSCSHQSDNLSEVQTQIFNLTIAPKSWAVGILKESKGGKLSYEVALTRTAVASEVNGMCDYVASWSERSSKIHFIEQPQLKISVDIEMQVIDSQELAEKCSAVKAQELAGLWNQLVTVNLSFHYPISGPESVKVEGYVIASGGPTTTRFQNHFEIESSYHNLQLTSHSVYKSDEDFFSLRYNSCLTHVPTDKKAFHSVHFWLSTPAGECSEAEFNHTILSRVFDLSTIVTYRCKPNQKDLHDLRLNLRSNSSDWNMLNLSINQLVEDQTPEYTFETCNVTHPLLLINVTADWVGKVRDHKKRALFTCRQENCQSTELLIQALHDGKMAADLIIPDGSKRKKLSLERIISSDAKTQNCKITFSNGKEHDSEGLHLRGEILNEKYQVWNLKLHLDACAEIYALFGRGYQSVLSQVTTIAKDAHHPVNKMLHSSFKMTLYEYFENLSKQGNYILINSWKNFVETVGSLKSFYEAPITLLLNMMIGSKTYFTLKDDSIIKSVTSYMNFASYFYNMKESIYQFLTPREEIMELEFVTSRVLELESFNQLPSISLKEINFSPFTGKKFQGLTEGKKIAMVISSSHAFRFDEHLYPSILSSSECVFLLAKDVRHSAFTVLSAPGMIHVLFPEMTVFVSKDNKVFINESRIPSKLPVETSSGNIEVKEDGTSVEIQSPSLLVNCRVQQTSHLCVLQLNVRQSSETFGLLESADEFNGKEFSITETEIRSSILKFVSKYEVSGKAECKNLNQQLRFPSSKSTAELCSRRLLQLCHLKWNIFQQFVEMCKLGFMEDAVSGYSALCNYRNLRNSTDLKENFHHHARQRIEIVFLIQEHRSLKTAEDIFEGVEHLQTAFSNHFAANGFSDVLFSLVGFGGQNSRGQSILHVKQKTWLVLHDALKRLKFDGEEDADIPYMLKAASQIVDCDLPHSKIFILLTTKETLSKHEDSVSEVKQFLKKSGIFLYTFFPRPLDSKAEDTFECTSQKEGTHPSEGCLPKPVSCTEGSVFCFFTEHSDSFFQTLAENMWSETTRGSLTCSTDRNWWKRSEVCPKI